MKIRLAHAGHPLKYLHYLKILFCIISKSELLQDQFQLKKSKLSSHSTPSLYIVDSNTPSVHTEYTVYAVTYIYLETNVSGLSQVKIPSIVSTVQNLCNREHIHILTKFHNLSDAFMVYMVHGTPMQHFVCTKWTILHIPTI